MKKLVNNVVPESILRIAQLRALKLFSDVIKCTYGPLGGNTAYSKDDGTTKAIVSNYSKDGFTILKNIEVDQPIESLLREEIRDICTQVIKVVGDGTSSAVMLSYLIFKGMLELHSKKYSKRMIIRTFKDLVKEISTKVESYGREVSLDDIYKIALTSLNGNEEMAKIITQIYKEYGMHVFIDVQGSNGVETIAKGYDGMIYDNGYLDPCFVNTEGSYTCDLTNAKVYVFESPVDTPTMIDTFRLIVYNEVEKPIANLRKLVNDHKWEKLSNEKRQELMPSPTIIFAPYFSRDANSYLDQIIGTYTATPIGQRGNFCIVQMGNGDPNKLIDIMKMTGAKFIKKYINPEQFEADQKMNLAPNAINIKTFAGSAEHIIVDKISTKIINPQNMRDENGKLTDFFTNYIGELKDQVSKLEETRAEIVEIGKLRRRINILLGNMVDLFIGGIGTSDRRSLTDAVEDAVLNCRSAAEEGVGNGASFDGLRASVEIYKECKEKVDNDYIDNEKGIEYWTTKAEVAGLIATSYINIITSLYEPFFEDKACAFEFAKNLLDTEKNPKQVPFNIISGEYDGSVLTSIKTEPAILDSISRIISVLFDTNQYLVPSPKYNIYTESDLVIAGTNNNSEEVKEEEEEISSILDVKEFVFDEAKSEDEDI